MSLEPGQILDGKYRVGRLIGEGGMGTVYEGENSRIGRRVAIKVLHTHVASMPEFVERFEREARASARIGSPHVCDVLDLGDLPSGDRYIVMEYLDGVSFEDRIVERGKMTAGQLAPIAFELLEGLGTMHLARVIHRDLKPANVFLARTPSGRGEIVKILDFGVAKLQPFEGEVGTMTQTGTMMGTPLYMSPEQARGSRDVDGRTDLYAASVMFYRALAGVLPYTADTLNELLFKIVLEEPRPLRDVAPEVDEVFAAIVHKGLSRDLTKRFQTAREYQEEIAAWGKTQGRASLSFAVTMQTEPPEPTAVPRDVPFVLTTPNAARPNDGTPISWSEDGPEAARRASSQGRVAVRPAAGAPSDPAMTNAPVAGGRSAPPRGGAQVSAPPAASSAPAIPAAVPVFPAGPAMSISTSTVAMRSETLPSGPWVATPEAIPVNAITSPRVDIPVPAAIAPPPARAANRLPAVAIGLGAAGAAAALALAAFFAFGRGATAPPTTGLTAAAHELPSSTSSATTASSALALTDTTAPTASSTPRADAGPPTTVATSDSATASPRREPPAAPARRNDPKATAPTATGAPSQAAATIPTNAGVPAVPVAPTGSTKPTASAARKFRTNLD